MTHVLHCSSFSGHSNYYPRTGATTCLVHVYWSLPDTSKPFDVYYDQVTDGGGWTMFQRWQDGFKNFWHNRVEYIRVFGDHAGEHWLGLEKIYCFTKWADFQPELND